MDINGSSQKISDLQREHRASLSKLKDQYEKKLENIQKNHEKTISNKDELHEQNRQSILENSNERIDLLSTKAKKTFAKNRSEYLDEVAKLKESHQHKVDETRKDFNTRLDNLKNSYTDSLRSKQKENQTLLDNKDANFEKRVGELQNREIENEKQRTIRNERSIASLEDQFSNERKELVDHFKNKEQQLNLSHLKERDGQRQDSLDTLKRVSDAKDAQIDGLQRRMNDSKDLLKEKSVNGHSRLQERFQQSITSLEEGAKREARLTQEGFNRDLARNALDHKEALSAKDRTIKKILNNSLTSADLDRHGAKISDDYEQKLNQMKLMMEDQQVNFRNKVDDLKLTSEKTMAERLGTLRDTFEESDNQRREQIIEQKVKGDEAVKHAESQMRRNIYNQQINSQNQLLNEQQKNNKLLHNQRVVYGENVQQLEQRNLDNVQKLQREHAGEKRDIVEQFSKNLKDSVLSQQQEFETKLNKVVTSYEQRLKTQKEAFMKLEEQSQGQLTNYKRSNDMKLRVEQKYFQERLKENRSEMKREIANLRTDFERNMNIVKAKYDDEINKIKRENDVYSTKLIQTHEQEKQELIMTNQQEMRSKVHQLTEQLARVMKDNEFQKQQLVDSYEKRIKDLKRDFDLEKVQIYNS
ncbi:hypothetical protein HBN50_10800 [Halobacteriovorax sp. GB3]|uniref:hypothetical protein n=1 Tax=Halobacteriovorax sp. GB3 TaxID=2719615 RepID=UPI00235DD546|nr:hypothetical protein [Halobacteriovorax sp. GB3]MDD0853591.1 hypothetical protein [Halobacteriovorax sp. GB3]